MLEFTDHSTIGVYRIIGWGENFLLEKFYIDGKIDLFGRS
jgi:hypothetical protein